MCVVIYFFKQLLVVSGVCSSFFLIGLNVGTPVYQSNKNNSTVVLTPEDVSWPWTLFGYVGIPWVFVLTAVAAFLGRKITHIAVCVSAIIGFMVCIWRPDLHQILINEVFQGSVMISYETISLIIITEYSSPRYRGLFLALKSTDYYRGVLTATTIGLFFNPKYIAVYGYLCSVYGLVIVYFWPESPFWLAQMGRFDECEKSLKWLQGDNEATRKELENFKLDEKNNIKEPTLKGRLNNLLKVITERAFYKPVLLSLLLIALYTFSGEIVYTMYSTHIFKQKNSRNFWIWIFSAIAGFSMYVGCVFANIFKRRSLFRNTAAASISFLFLISVYESLVKASAIYEHTNISVLLLIGFSVTVGCGPMVLSIAITGEIMPLHSRCFSVCAIAIGFKIIDGCIKTACQYSTNYLDIHGTLFLFGVCSTILLVLIHHYLPETKDKTLHEIEEIMKNGPPVEEDIEMATFSMDETIIMLDHGGKGTSK